MTNLRDSHAKSSVRFNESSKLVSYESPYLRTIKYTWCKLLYADSFELVVHEGKSKKKNFFFPVSLQSSLDCLMCRGGSTTLLGGSHRF